VILLVCTFPKSAKLITYDPYRDQRDRNHNDRDASRPAVVDTAIGGGPPHA
jgi:hypothetical protein